MASNHKIYDARFKHPFTCILAGPSRAGKSTWVKNLLQNETLQLNVVFDKIIIILGTKLSENRIFQKLQKEKGEDRITVIELLEYYKDSKQLMNEFPQDFLELLQSIKDGNGEKVLLIVDDLMSQLADCDVLVNIFSKYSSHYEVSVINITQNVFYKGKKSSDHVTVFRNTHHPVVFQNKMDVSVMVNIARKISFGSYKPLAELFNKVLKKFHYIVIDGTFDSPSEI